ncbi:hypothetical protein V2J09_020043 [Rumex salicifolius]
MPCLLRQGDDARLLITLRLRSVVYRLIMDAPNLAELRIEITTKVDESEASCGCASNFALKKLRFITFQDVLGLPREKEFIKFLVVQVVFLLMRCKN